MTLEDCYNQHGLLVNPTDTTKLCSYCKINKPLSMFGRKCGKLASHCIICSRIINKNSYNKHREKRIEIKNRYEEENADKIKNKQLEYYNRNKERIKKRDDARRDKINEYNRSYASSSAGITKRREYTRNRRRTDPQYRLSLIMSCNIWNAIKDVKGGISWEKLVGYTAEELKIHLESLWQPGMTWENHGVNGWHVDHKIPKSWFKYSSHEDKQFKRCWELNNLQPKWAEENRIKSNKFVG